MKVSYQPGALLDVAVADLASVVVRLGFATLHHLGLEELPQPAPSGVAILNVTGWCSFPDRPRGGLCVMMAGHDRNGVMLWACSLPAYSPRDDEPQRLFESLLVDPEVVGRTHRVTLRVSGGLFGHDTTGHSENL